MSNVEPRPSGDEPHLKGMKSFRCTFGPIAETDFVWPPPPADLEGCSVVRLSEELDPQGQHARVTLEDFRPHTTQPDDAIDADAPTQEIPIPPAVLARLAVQPEQARSEQEAPDALQLEPEPEPAPAPAWEPELERTAEPAAAGADPSELPPLIPLLPDEPEIEDEPEEEAPVFAFAPPSPESRVETPAMRGGLAWAAAFAAISCVAVSYSEFRAGRREAVQVVHASDVPPATEKAGAPVSPEAEPVVTFERAPVAPPRAAATAPRPEPDTARVAPPDTAKDAKPGGRPRAAEPARRREPEPEPRVVLRAASLTSPRPAPVAPSNLAAPAPGSAPARTATANANPTSVPAREPVPAATPTFALATPTVVDEPVLHAAVLDTTAEDAAAADEAHIESTLTRFRTAYSKLDARAAREVWPSVDVEALDRAFRSLKSQDLRFDRCDLTVDGQRARAACRGSAVYVPRVGNQSPKATPREWNFELKKLDQRWTIASARSM